MDTDKLRLFVKIAETENLTKAAEELGYTQSGASHAIRSLEEELGGVKLFTRGRDGSLLTPAGRVAIAGVKEILYWERQVKKEIFKEIENVSVLRVAFLPSLSKNWMYPIIDQMRTRYPTVRIETMVSDNRTVLQLLASGEVDCAFGSMNKSTPITSKISWDDPYVAVVSERHPLAKKEEVSLAELCQYTFVRTFWDLYDDIIRDVKGQGVDLKVRHSATQYSEIFDSVRDYHSVSIIPSTLQDSGPNEIYKGIVFLPIKERLSRNIGILVYNSKSIHKMVKPFCDVTKELFDCGMIKIPEIMRK